MSNTVRFVCGTFLIALMVACSGPPTPPTPPAPPPPVTETLGPRVLGATSIDSNTLVVSFSKELKGGTDSAEFAGHYSIISSNAVGATAFRVNAKPTSDRVVRPLSLAIVVKAVLSTDKKSVTLTTLDQAAIEYTLKVVNVKDLQGNPVVPPDRNNPFQVKFTGKDPTGVKKDTDGDGVEDFFEQLGWDVVVFAVDGTRSVTNVTSDPFNKDTEGDGLSDLGEISNQLDPRSSDTDGDRLLDADELNVWLTDAAKGDTDGDKLSDGNEVEQFKTNPREADTDGDALSDFDEVGQGKTNARNADLPRVNIGVGSVGLQLDYRFDETVGTQTTTGMKKEMTQTSLQAQTTATTQENSSANDWFVKAGVEVCVSGSCNGENPTKQVGAKFTAEAGGGASYSFTSSISSEQNAQQEYATTLVDDTQSQQGKTVTRQLNGAKMLLNATLTNVSPWSFDVSNLEVRAERRDPADRTKLIPVATFRPLPNTVVSLSPISSKTQTVALDADNPIPSVVEGLLSDPENLIFTVSQFKISVKDRALIYTEQEVYRRSAFLEIDYQGREGKKLEQYRPAAYFGFNADQSLKGITLKQVMEEILGMKHIVATPSGSGCTEATPSDQQETSYSTCVINNVQALWRVRTVTRTTGKPQSWWVLTPKGLITPLPEAQPPFAGSDFNSLVVLPGQDLAFKFVKDEDTDGLEAGEEARLGSNDTKRDSDGDGLSDADEVLGFVGSSGKRTPWEVKLDDAPLPITVASNPSRPDTDSDGLSDCQELSPIINGAPAPCARVYFSTDANGVSVVSTVPTGTSMFLPKPTDPGDSDTDADGIPDQKEVVGLNYLALNTVNVTLPMANAILSPRTVPNTTPAIFTPAINPLSRDTDKDTLPDGKEIKIGTNPLKDDGDKVWDKDGDGLVNVVETQGWLVLYYGVDVLNPLNGALTSLGVVTSDPNIADTDGDGLKDNEERTIATSPRAIDTDADLLSDSAELKPSTAGRPKTDPLDQDTDNDKLVDGREVLTPVTYQVFGAPTQTQAFSDPTKADTDGDGLGDGDEFFGGLFTDPTKPDTDGDGTNDRVEVLRQADANAAKRTNPLRADQLLRIFFQARGVPFTNGLICGVLGGGSANFRGTFIATLNNVDISGGPFNNNFSSTFSQDPYPARFAIITSNNVRVRSEGLSRWDGGIRYGLTDFDDTLSPAPDPKTFFGGTVTKTYRQKQAGANDDICSMEVQFIATPVTQ